MRLKVPGPKNIKPFLISLLVMSSFLIAPQVLAWDADVLGSVIGWIIGVFISALGLILILVIKGLLIIASYQEFISSRAVIEGWVIVRDLANMFFVVILLVIAFATILHIESYNYKKWLPKLILMAILINFSKTICGLLIDVAQIVMLTFVNAFKDIAGGNFITLLGIRDIITLSTESDPGKLGFWTIVGAYVLGLIYMIVALVVMTTMMMILAMRMVMIWIYVVLSPLAYLLAAFPGGAQYASKWWKDFISNLIVGPVLAFFIWLSFAALQTGNIDQSIADAQKQSVASEQEAIGYDENKAVINTLASTPGALIKFIVGIGMLIGGLKIAQEVGGAAGSIAGKGMSKLNSMGAATAKFAGRSVAQVSGNIGMGIAKKAKLKEGLGFVASRTGGVGTILAATGIRGLATRSLVSLNSQQKKIEEKAGAKLENLKDTRVIARYANESSLTGMGAAMRKKARNKMPSAIKDYDEMNKAIAAMSRDDLGKVSDAEWSALGDRGAVLGGRAATFINKDSDARGAYNHGMTTSIRPAVIGRAPIVGTDSRGRPLTSDDMYGSYMNPKRPPSPDEINTLDRKDDHMFDYLKQPPALEPDHTTKVSNEDQDKDRGKGNLSINKFADGQSTLAVDFDKLNLDDIEKGAAGDKDWRNTRGVNTSNPEAIKKIADSMLGLIDQEISTLKAKPQLSGGEEKRLSSLSNAKDRFSNPESMSNLSLINSSASNFKTSDVKESIIHEEIHALGYEDEGDVRKATGHIMATRDYDARKDKSSIDKILGKDQTNTRPVDEIISKENESKSPVIFSDEAQVDTSRLEKTLSNFVNQLKLGTDNLKNISGSSNNTNNQPKDYSYFFKRLITAISVNKKAQSAAHALGGNESETPLEFSVIMKNMPADLYNDDKN